MTEEGTVVSRRGSEDKEVDSETLRMEFQLTEMWGVDLGKSIGFLLVLFQLHKPQHWLSGENWGDSVGLLSSAF